MTSWVGSKLAGGRYRVTAKLGEGGMGFVWQAHDGNLDTEVVIKVPRPEMLANPQFAGRFAREVRSLVKLSHPHIVKVMDVGEHDGVPFAVLQYLSGGSLRDRLRKGTGGRTVAMKADDLSGWLEAIAEALDYIHQQGYIHRDVKPDNILFDAAGHAYLGDFGVSKVLADSRPRQDKTVLTATGAVIGTPRYLAPELLQEKDYDGRLDQYALAVTVYEILCGQPPFDGPSAVVIALHMTQPPPSMHEVTPSISKTLSAAVNRGLAKDPAQRYASCGAFAQAVLASLGGSPRSVAATPRGRPKAQPPATRLPKTVREETQPGQRSATVVEPPFAFTPSSPQPAPLQKKAQFSVVLAAAVIVLALVGALALVVYKESKRREQRAPGAVDGDGAKKKVAVVAKKDAEKAPDAMTPTGTKQEPASVTKQEPESGTKQEPTPKMDPTPTSTTEPDSKPERKPDRMELLRKYGGNEASEAAVAAGLKWMAAHQAPDGHWSFANFHQHGKCNCTGQSTHDDIAATAFGLLPFLADGHTHKARADKSDPYTEVVDRGLKYLILKQNRDGEFHSLMYSQGLASMAVCEAYGRTSDPVLRGPAQRCLNYIIDAQSGEGGWRYGRRQAGYDTSVSGWQLAALKSGQRAGLDVPVRTLKACNKWLDDAGVPDGGSYGYCSRGEGQNTSAVGLLCRQHLGWGPRNPGMLAGVDRLTRWGPQPAAMYYSYYATQVLHNMGGTAWDNWNPKMRDGLINAQDKGDKVPHQKGSWNGGYAGRLMELSLSLLTLEVYYRQPELYRGDFDKAIMENK